jgi:metal-sulfur cluster biosynthetic enzyme/ribosomal protein L22
MTPTATTLDVSQKQVRVPHTEARAALDAVLGLDTTAAISRLRQGPGRTCEPVARVLDRAVVNARESGLDPTLLVIAAADVTPGQGITRVRRKSHGNADWITSVTSDLSIVLVPRGLYETSTFTVEAAVPDAHTPPTSPPTDAHPLVPAIRERLLDVIDPDLGINVVDLGFVRGVSVADGIAILTMTLTSPACPLTGVMEDQIRTELLDQDPLVDDFRIDWQWTPAWSPAEISADGHEQLRAIGFNI